MEGGTTWQKVGLTSMQKVGVPSQSPTVSGMAFMDVPNTKYSVCHMRGFRAHHQ